MSAHKHYATYLAFATWGVACFVSAPIHIMSLVLMLGVVPLLIALTIFVARWEARRDLRRSNQGN